MFVGEPHEYQFENLFELYISVSLINPQFVYRHVIANYFHSKEGEHKALTEAHGEVPFYQQGIAEDTEVK